MLVQFLNARVLDTGFYEITDARTGVKQKYPWIELIQRGDEAPAGSPVRDSTGPQRFSVQKDVELPDGLGFGVVVSGWFETSDQTKVITGTDRSVDQIRLQIVALAVAKAVERPRTAAAA